MANSVIILNDGTFVTAPPDKIIFGTTLKKIIKYVEEDLVFII